MATLLTTNEAKQILKVDRSTINRWTKQGLLKKMKVSSDSRSVRYDEKEVRSLFKKEVNS